MLPPVVPGKPLIGNALDLWTNPPEKMRAWQREYGDIFTIHMLSAPVTVLLGPEYHATFFQETDKGLNLDEAYESLKAIFGEMSLTAPPDVYARQRPILQVPFKREKMVHYLEVMQEVVQEWLDGLDDCGMMELTSEVNRLVQRVAGKAFMGPDFLNRVGQEFWQLYAMLAQCLNPLIPPYWPAPRNVKREWAKWRMYRILAPIIAERRANPEKYNDFLQDFVNARYPDGSEVETKEIVVILKGLMFASHETTAGQAAWTILELLRHPEYRALVEAEIADYAPPGTPLNGQSIRRLEHIQWAVREVERLHPSAGMLMRKMKQPMTFGAYTLPVDTTLMTVPGAAHRMTSLFPNPDQFDPLRFGPDRKEDEQHRFALIGFGGGTHKCMGMNFANNEMLIITTLLFQQFELELLSEKVETLYGMGASRPTPAHVMFRRKQQFRRSSHTQSAGSI